MPEKFIDKRLKVTMVDATLLRRGEERRHHLRVEINLSADSVMAGMPEWIQNQYTLMQKAANKADDIKCKQTTFENMSLGFWATEKTRTKFFPQVNGAMLSKFVMSREGKGDEADVFLTFSIHFPGSKQIHDWTYDHKNADFWIDFEQQQGELAMSEEEEEADEQERQQRHRDERASVEAAKKKLGVVH